MGFKLFLRVFGREVLQKFLHRLGVGVGLDVQFFQQFLEACEVDIVAEERNLLGEL